MNRIETKIIMMVTNRLSAARDSDTKTELIEELSENLYQRYLDLTAGGMAEEEALAEAMETLGDVSELLKYLEDADGQNQDTDGRGADPEEQKDSRKNHSFTFNTADLENSIEDIVNSALSSAKDAVDCAKDVARDVSEQLKEKYPDGIFMAFTSQRCQAVSSESVPSEGIHSLDVRLTNGDIRLCLSEDLYAPIEITGDTEEIQTVLKNEGILSVKQGNTASSSFLFNRGVRASNIEIRLPKRFWTNISLSTVNGDIRIDSGLSCKGLAIQTSSGDLDVQELHGDRMAFRMASGDISAKGLSGDLYAETKSGDIQVWGRLGKCGISTASGDVQFEGESREMSCSSVSGDVALELNCLPEKIKAAVKSGDCRIKLPSADGFRVSYQTVSGDFRSAFPLTGTQDPKGGKASYLDGGSCEIQLSSVSGDMTIHTL